MSETENLKVAHDRKPQYSLIVAFVLVFPYYFNDILFVLLQSFFTAFELVDIITRVATLAFLVYAVGFSTLKSYAGLPKISTLLASLFIVALYLGVREVWTTYFSDLLSTFKYYSFPAYPSLASRIFDLSIGLILVALSEELIFRFYLVKFFKKCNFGAPAIVLLSSVIFATMHWGTGLENVLLCFFFGVIVCTYYIKTDDLMSCVIAHYAVNLLIFGFGF